MKSRFLKQELVSFTQIQRYLKKSFDGILTSKKILKISSEESFKTTYDAMLKTTLALILNQGMRPRTQVGHHVVMIQYAEKILGRENSLIIKRFHRMRKKRNKLIYDIALVSRQEAEQSIELAEKYFQVVKNYIEKKNPQKRLL